MHYCITMERTQRFAVCSEADSDKAAEEKAERINRDASLEDFAGGDVDWDYALYNEDTKKQFLIGSKNMTLFLTATTQIKDVFIDFIEVCLIDGSTVSLNWDESDIDRIPSGFSAQYKGLCFDEEYANGKLELLIGLTVTGLQLYSESEETGEITIDEMIFEDGNDEYSLVTPIYSKRGCDLSG